MLLFSTEEICVRPEETDDLHRKQIGAEFERTILNEMPFRPALTLKLFLLRVCNSGILRARTGGHQWRSHLDQIPTESPYSLDPRRVWNKGVSRIVHFCQRLQPWGTSPKTDSRNSDFRHEGESGFSNAENGAHPRGFR